MRLTPTQKLWAPKAGNPPDEYEDASRVAYPYRHAPGVVARAAISDGASESAFAKSWAKILADAFVENPLDLSHLNAPALTGLACPLPKAMECRRAVAAPPLARRSQSPQRRNGNPIGRHLSRKAKPPPP